MDINCDFHPTIESTFECDFCKKKLCLADKKTILYEIEIGSGDDTTTFTDVLTLCYECEVERRLHKLEEENDSWLKVVLGTLFLIPIALLLIGIGGIGFYYLLLFLLDPAQMYNEYAKSVVGIPFLSVFLGVFGIVGLYLIYIVVTGIWKKITSKPEIELENLVQEQKQIKTAITEPQTISQQDFVCAFHKSREAVESCYKCQRWICREDKYTDKTNRSVPEAVRTSDELRQAVLCPVCYYEDKINKEKQKTWTTFAIMTIFLMPIIWAGFLLFSIGLQLDDYLFMISIVDALIPLLILAYMGMQRVRKPKLIHELEYKKNLFLQSKSEIQLSDLEPINNNLKKEPPYCFQCGDKTTFGTRFEISKDQFMCTACYYENHGKLTAKYRITFKILAIILGLSPLIIIFTLMFSIMVGIIYFLPYGLFVGHIISFNSSSLIPPLSFNEYFIIFILGIFSILFFAFYMNTKSFLPKHAYSKSEWVTQKEDFQEHKVELLKTQPTCKYHPKVDATARCEQCASFICGEDTKTFQKRRYTTNTDEEVQSSDLKKENEFITSKKGPTVCPECYIDARILDYDNSAKTNFITIYYYLYFLLFSLALLTDLVTYSAYANVLVLILIAWGYKKSIAGKMKMRTYKKVRIKQLEKEKEQFQMETGYYTGD